VAPAVDQVEYSPYLPQRELLACCRERGIQLESYSPLKGRRLGDARLRAIAERHGKTAASDGASHGVSHGASHGTGGGSVGRTGGIRLDECLSVR
jgi:aryl-alcohol dehydrogenase-like predicted oxidoreductase